MTRNGPYRVKITEGHKAFVGKTGTAIHEGYDGKTKMWRVRLDEPVEIPAVGTVTDDVWATTYLRIIK